MRLKKITFLFIFILSHFSFPCSSWFQNSCYNKCRDNDCFSRLLEGSPHVVRQDRSCTESYNVHCHFWHMSRCKHYRTNYYSILRCENGYRSHVDPTTCPFAICNGKINPEGACSKYMEIRNRDGRNRTEHSQGDCQKPDLCICRSMNFYGEGGACKACTTIPNCHEVQCTTASNYKCVYCHGEVKPNRFFRAYTREPDPKKCQKACSWRADSTRCFPGQCDQELASKCKCTKGFTGHHCHIMQDYADIKYSMCTLKIGNLKKLDNPSNPNEISSTEVIWTKETGWSTAETKWDAQYKLQESPPDMTDHYVRTFVYGIVSAMTTLQYISGTDYKDEYFYWDCPGVHEDKPVASPFSCHKTFSLQNSLHFKHNDTYASISLNRRIKTVNIGFS